MKMLPKYRRYRIINKSGQVLDKTAGAIELRLSPWKIASGELEQVAVIVDDLGFDGAADLNDGVSTEGSVIDNTTDLYWGESGVITVLHDVAAADGSFDLYVEYCDDNSTWPSDATDFSDANITDLQFVCSVPIDNTAVNKSRRVNFEL